MKSTKGRKTTWHSAPTFAETQTIRVSRYIANQVLAYAHNLDAIQTGLQKHNYGALMMQMTRLLQDEQVVRLSDREAILRYLTHLLEAKSWATKK